VPTRFCAVDPRLLDVKLVEVVAREVSLADFAVDPDMSLKRFVVPRVAPILEAGVELLAPLKPELSPPDDDDELELLELEVDPELELAVLAVATVLEPPPPPEKVR
jgi:hypothetical protein